MSPVWATPRCSARNACARQPGKEQEALPSSQQGSALSSVHFVHQKPLQHPGNRRAVPCLLFIIDQSSVLACFGNFSCNLEHVELHSLNTHSLLKQLAPFCPALTTSTPEWN